MVAPVVEKALTLSKKASVKLAEKSSGPKTDNLDSLSDEQIQQFVDYSAAFHKICEERIIDKEDFSKSLSIFDLL